MSKIQIILDRLSEGPATLDDLTRAVIAAGFHDHNARLSQHLLQNCRKYRHAAIRFDRADNTYTMLHCGREQFIKPVDGGWSVYTDCRVWSRPMPEDKARELLARCQREHPEVYR